jgi:hypothetical protein
MIKEKLRSTVGAFQTKRLHNRSLMEIATTFKVLDTIPPLEPFPRVVAAAARLGGGYDDCFDLGVNRREVASAFGRDGEKGYFGTTPHYLMQYQQAFYGFIKEVSQSSLNKNRKPDMIETSRKFTSNLATVELCALFLPETEWSSQKAVQYRKAVCLLWATYFSALGSDKKLQLEDFDIDEGIDGPKNHYSVYLEEDSKEAVWVQKLYSGAVAYQLVCDWTGKRFNRKKFIPGFASLNQETQTADHQEYKRILNTCIAEARENGMSVSEDLILRYVFPTFRSLANLRAK